MKGGGGGGGSSFTLPSKRRWKGLVIAVLGLVFLSMLVPLFFLLGLYNGFHSTSGYSTEHRSTAAHSIRVYDQPEGSYTKNQSEGDRSTHVDNLIKRLGPTLPKVLCILL
ncbi:unnamed protein product [Ilex paraguariensis]|uniref:Uncharacterized protein n=1 Tax=Ilex paraguariensis TaxID=185542 RepID=A0ABC8R7X7_9AQUA